MLNNENHLVRTTHRWRTIVAENNAPNVLYICRYIDVRVSGIPKAVGRLSHTGLLLPNSATRGDGLLVFTLEFINTKLHILCNKTLRVVLYKNYYTGPH